MLEHLSLWALGIGGAFAAKVCTLAASARLVAGTSNDKLSCMEPAVNSQIEKCCAHDVLLA